MIFYFKIEGQKFDLEMLTLSWKFAATVFKLEDLNI